MKKLPILRSTHRKEESARGGGKPLSHQGWYRWIVLSLLWLIYAAFGLISRAIFPLVTPILSDLSLSYTEMGIILGSWQLAYIPASLAAGPILDRWGVRKSLLFGAFMMCLSATLRFYAAGFATMLIAVALFGVGGPMISIGGPKVISERFSGRSRGTAIGIHMMGPSIGGILALTLTNSLVMPLTGNSWRLTFVAYGFLVFTVGLLWWFFSAVPSHGGASHESGIIEVFRSLIKVWNVKILLAMALLSFLITHGFISWLPRILETSGMSASEAGFAAAIPLAAGIPSVLAIPRLVPITQRGRFLSIFSLLASMGLLIVVNASGPLLIAGLILLGITSSCFMPMMLLILMDTSEVEPRNMGSAGGMFFCVAEIGGFSGPFFIGAFVDITGTFLAGAIFLSALCIGISALTLLLKTQADSLSNISSA
jgi:CP family cyanate transporter-like MFS transporter